MSRNKFLVVAVATLACVAGFIGWVASGGFGSSPTATPSIASSPSASAAAEVQPGPLECQNFVSYWNSTLKNVVGNLSWLDQSSGISQEQASSDFYRLASMLDETDRYSTSLRGDAQVLSVSPYDSQTAAVFVVDENLFEQKCGISSN